MGFDESPSQFLEERHPQTRFEFMDFFQRKRSPRGTECAPSALKIPFNRTMILTPDVIQVRAEVFDQVNLMDSRYE